MSYSFNEGFVYDAVAALWSWWKEMEWMEHQQTLVKVGLKSEALSSEMVVRCQLWYSENGDWHVKKDCC